MRSDCFCVFDASSATFSIYTYDVFKLSEYCKIQFRPANDATVKRHLADKYCELRVCRCVALGVS